MNQRGNVAAVVAVGERGAERRVFQPGDRRRKRRGLPLTFAPALEARCDRMQIGRGPLKRR